MRKFTEKPLLVRRRNLVIIAASAVFLFVAIFPTNNVLIIEGDRGSNIQVRNLIYIVSGILMMYPALMAKIVGAAFFGAIVFIQRRSRKAA